MTLYNLFGWLFASLFCSLFCSSFAFTSKKSKKNQQRNSQCLSAFLSLYFLLFQATLLCYFASIKALVTLHHILLNSLDNFFLYLLAIFIKKTLINITLLSY
ncbi:hypothetical protein EDC96DRAFT_528417 [Choanephora cucurbitarum]|nr:hypothetical protein EDC96DRAFT_528417 [Choanephora cucurbitarum]